MAPTHLTLLGGFEVRLGTGAAVALPTHKYRALLAFLAMPAGRAHPREKLVALLWDDLPRDRGRAAVRQALLAIRRTLHRANAPGLILREDTVALNPAAVWVDVAEFERAVAGAQRASLERAAALYRGDFLAGLPLAGSPFEEWLTTERERLRERAIEVFARLLAEQRRAGDLEEAVQTALRLLALDPLQEAVHRTLMRVYVALGRRGAALRQYQLCAAALQRELGVEPEAETRAIFLELVPSDVPAPANADITLPAEAESPGEVPLIGRTEALDALVPLLDSLADRRGHVVMLLGEAGVGKSRIVAELVRQSARRRHGVIAGRCHEAEQVLPFRPWIDALRGAPLAATVGGLSVSCRFQLARLFPELAHHVIDVAEGDPDPTKLFEAVGQLLALLCATRPQLLVLEDIHWADEMSLRLIAFIGRRILTRPLLLVATIREEDLAEAQILRRIVNDLARSSHVIRMSVEPLPQDETADLVRALVPSASRESLAQITEQTWMASEGNPFVVVEMMRALEHGVPLTSQTGLPLPKRVRELVGRRLEQLSPSGKAVAALAAVIGREFDFPLLHRASTLDERSAADAVEELVRRRILHSVGERFEFTHARIRAVAHTSLLAPHRRLLHRAVAETLESQHAGHPDSDRLDVAIHYREAQVWDKAVRYLRAAGIEAFRRSACRAAASLFEDAILACGRRPESDETMREACDLRLHAVRALIPVGQFSRIHEHLGAAERLAAALDDPPRIGRVANFLSRYFWVVGDTGRGRAAGEQALAVAAELNDLLLAAMARYSIGIVCHATGDYGTAIEVLSHNVAAWRRAAGHHARPDEVDLPRSIVDDLVWLAWCHAERGDHELALAASRDAIRQAESEERAPLLVGGHFALGMTHLRHGDISEAISALERGAALARERDVITWLGPMTSALGAAYSAAGRNDEALPLLEQAIEQDETVGAMIWRALLVGWLGEVYLRAGRLADAEAAAQHAVALARAHGERGHEAWALRLLGEVNAATARPADAEACYAQALALAEELGMRPLAAQGELGLGALHTRAERDS